MNTRLADGVEMIARNRRHMCLWVPGSRLRRAPE
jgi:hypothetical protein